MIALAMFGVASLYASVGHGGASGYLAVLSLAGLMAPAMASSILMVNLMVAGLAFVTFRHHGHFAWRTLWPFLLTSVPAAVLGGMAPVSDTLFRVAAAGVLIVASWRLWSRIAATGVPLTGEPMPPIPVALPLGAGIGFVSGIVGIGGGIFLSPLLVLARWAHAKRAAGCAAAFIVWNSLAGLIGRIVVGQETLEITWPWVLTALAGGWVGAQFGARRAASVTLCRLLAVVLVIAAGKLVFHHG